MTVYAGPGRRLSPPQDIQEVKIGWFAPTDPDHPKAGAMWCAAQMAVEEANVAGGHEGLPFRLVASWSENPWATGIAGVTRLAYDEGVWAIVGAPDGPSAHLAAQAVTKARLVFLSPVATDKTANLANVPWIFSCAPGDHLLAPLLAEAVVSETAGKNIAVVSCTDHDSRLFTTELLAALKQLGAFPDLHLHFRPGKADFPRPLEILREAVVTGTDQSPVRALDGEGRDALAAIVLVAGPKDAGRFLTALRRAGIPLPVFGGPRMGQRLFLQSAGPFAESVTFPLLWDSRAAGEKAAAFARSFRNRFGVEPDYTAAYTYDAVNLLIAAIRQAGLNRVRIRDALRNLSPWPGVTGLITWDPTGHNRRCVRLGRL